MAIQKEEFNRMIFSRINNLIDDYNLINEGEKIAIALSGGKDSVLTLHALKNYWENADFDFELVAISVDEGIEGYRQHGIDSAVSNAKLCDVPLIQKSFLEEESFALDDIYSYFKSACIPCGVFRRNILNKTAYEIGADKIATGHNLDDEIQSFLMSFSRGETVKFSKFGPELNQIHEKLVPRIKPLWNTPEKEVGTWRPRLLSGMSARQLPPQFSITSGRTFILISTWILLMHPASSWTPLFPARPSAGRITAF